MERHSLQVPSPTTTEQWLHEARHGSDEALGRLLITCWHYLLLVAHAEMGPELRAKGGASDLVQDTFLEAHREFSHFQGNSPAELRFWLRHILRNNLANFSRHYHTYKRQASREVSLDTSHGSTDLRGFLAADTPTPVTEVIAQEQARAVEEALNRLPDHYRQVILWHNRANLDFAQIGRLLGRSADSARMLWWRAIERLQSELERTP